MLLVFSLVLPALALLQIPPPMPAAWPSIDEAVEITGAFLKDPLVVDALAHVVSVVDQTLLNIPVATFVSGAQVIYNGDATANCYWPANLCLRTAPTSNFNADIVSCPQPDQWGITYDDGPTVTKPGTPEVRAMLNKANIKATFFMVGSNVVQNSMEMQSTFQDGHQIAVHTWTHHPLTSMTNEQVVAEIKYTEAIIYKQVGVVPRYFRPPYGDIDDRVRAILWALGYNTVIWNKDSGDADTNTQTTSMASQIVNLVKTWFVSGPGFITLEHDIDPFTSGIAVQVLQSIIDSGSNFPLKPMPVAQCLGDTQWYVTLNSSSTVPSSGSANTSVPVKATSTMSSTAATALSAPLFGNPSPNLTNDASLLQSNAFLMVLMAFVFLL